MLSIAQAPAMPARKAEKPVVVPTAMEPSTPPTKESMRAAWLKEHPRLTPQQALASGAELRPAYAGNARSDNHVSKVHTEIKVDGKVIARVYNSGAAEIADEYSFLGDEIDFSADRGSGPDLAESRARRIQAVLERHGALAREKLEPEALMAALQARIPVVELLRATTAQTQEEWLAFKATEATPGAVLSRNA